MRWMFLLAASLLLALTPAHAGGHPPPKIFLRIHVQTSGEGLPASQATNISLPPSGETIQVRTIPEFSERELIGVRVDPSGPVHLQFNHQGQVNLSAATGQNQGRILVVLIDGYVVYAPVIDEQITNGELILPHPLSPQIIQLLQQTAEQNVLKASKS